MRFIVRHVIANNSFVGTTVLRDCKSRAAFAVLVVVVSVEIAWSQLFISERHNNCSLPTMSPTLRSLALSREDIAKFVVSIWMPVLCFGACAEVGGNGLGDESEILVVHEVNHYSDNGIATRLGFYDPDTYAFEQNDLSQAEYDAYLFSSGQTQSEVLATGLATVYEDDVFFNVGEEMRAYVFVDESEDTLPEPNGLVVVEEVEVSDGQFTQIQARKKTTCSTRYVSRILGLGRICRIMKCDTMKGSPTYQTCRYSFL